MLKTLDYTIRIGSTPTFLHFDLNNYRPISIISIIAKIMEKLVHIQLYFYLQEANLITYKFATWL